jgi:hypothetical protein
MAATANAAERRDALVERLFMDAIGAFDLLSVYLGDVLGLYRTLADKGPLTSVELAEATGIHERYAREWLEHQAASSLLELEPNGDARHFRLPEGHDEALLDSSSLSYIAPLARSFAGAVKPLEELLAAFHSGEGVPYADYGDDLHEGQAAFTKPLYENLLAKEWLPGARPPRARARSRTAGAPSRQMASRGTSGPGGTLRHAPSPLGGRRVIESVGRAGQRELVGPRLPS